jgi:sugar lactone lactonase YvrE
VLFGVAFSTFCGGLPIDGAPARQSLVFAPQGLALSSSGLLAMTIGGLLYVVNETGQPVTLYPENATPLVIQPGTIRLAAGGGSQAPAFGTPVDARAAQLRLSNGVAWAANGDLLIAETGACRIDRIGDDGNLSVVAGQPCAQINDFADGPASVARFYAPFSVAEGPDDNLYVADTGNQRIREIDVTHGVVSTFAGFGVAGFAGDGGPALQAEFAYPASVSFAPDGSMILADALNNRVRRIAPDAQHTVTTLAGSGPSEANAACGSEVPCGHYAGDGGPATLAELNIPLDAVVTGGGVLLISDQNNDRIRAVQTSL